MTVEDFVIDRKNWMEWTRANLPNAKDFWVSDIDTIIRNRKGCFSLIEIKRMSAGSKTCQSATYHVLDHLFKNAVGSEFPPKPEIGIKLPIPINHFAGTYYITFEKTWFDDGKVYLNGKESSEQEIIDILSFADECETCFPDGCGESNED